MDEQASAHTVTAPISTISAGGANVATVGAVGASERSRAGICMWLVRQYIADIEAFYDGDENRFGRMVLDGGKGIPNAHPHGWAKLILRNIDDPTVQLLFGDEVEGYRNQLIEWQLI